MPSDIAVATVGSGGAQNAYVLADPTLALADSLYSADSGEVRGGLRRQATALRHVRLGRAVTDGSAVAEYGSRLREGGTVHRHPSPRFRLQTGISAGTGNRRYAGVRCTC